MINDAIMATNLFFDWKIPVFQGEVVGNVPLRCFSFSVMLHARLRFWLNRIRLQWLLNKKNDKNHGQKRNIGNHLINSTTWQAKDGMVGVSKMFYRKWPDSVSLITVEMKNKGNPQDGVRKTLHRPNRYCICCISAYVYELVSVGNDLKELGCQLPKCLKFCPGIEI